MRRMMAIAIGVVLAPPPAWACPGCVASPYGDRTFGWAYLTLYAAPFFIGLAIAGALLYLSRARGRAMTSIWDAFGLLERQPRRADDVAAGRGSTTPRETHALDKEMT